jgi:hypothetical protein
MVIRMTLGFAGRLETCATVANEAASKNAITDVAAKRIELSERWKLPDVERDLSLFFERHLP